MIRLACVLLNYRNPGDTLECLASLARGPHPGAKVFLVNNYAADGSGDALREGLASSGLGHAYLEPGSNTGFAGGCNLGLRAALGEGFTHCVLLNNDTLVEPGFLAEVARCAEAHPGEVLAGKVVNAATGGPTHNVGRVSRLTGRVLHVFDPADDEKIDFISGCLMVLPREAVEATGGFDERLFMYAEDLDLSLRLKRLGFPMRYCPSFVARHKESASAKVTRLPKEYYSVRNQTHVILRRGTLLQRFLYLAALPLLPLYKALRMPRTWGQSMRGARDGLAGRLGKNHPEA